MFRQHVNPHFLLVLNASAMLNLCQALWCLSSQLADSDNDRDGSSTFLILLENKSLPCGLRGLQSNHAVVSMIDMALCKAMSD